MGITESRFDTWIFKQFFSVLKNSKNTNWKCKKTNKNWKNIVVISRWKLQFLNICYCSFSDAYIDTTKIRAVNFVLQGNKGEALHLLNRKSVAESLKHLYRQYRLKKWCQVQDLVSNILQTLRPGQVTPAPMQTDNDPGYEGEQMQNYVQAMMVSQCNFRRES